MNYARAAVFAVDDPVATDAADIFGEALRDHRRAAGLTQEELAERAGVSPRSISGLERGEGGAPRRDTVALLARALGLVGVDREAFESTVVRRRRQRRSLTLAPVPRLADPPNDPPQHNPQLRVASVPRALTSFVGREQELSELGPMLETAPLVTLVGAGGIGKTRLAHELTRLHAATFADGARLVELGELTDPTLAASAVAAAVGLEDLHVRNTTDMLTDFLRPKHALLVLDNCERLVGAIAELVSLLLRVCPYLHVMATSREPLAIDGEITWLVRPLELPDSRYLASADQIVRSAAVRLFVERARAVSKAFVLTDDNAAAIARVCIAVDGIPLGLELAAARVRLLAVPQLADRLEHDGQILSGPKRDGSPRHRTIRATIDWSHDLLGGQEQILLRRLSLFAGGWNLDMAEDVCSGSGLERADVLEVLAQLVDRSMVLMTACDGVARYRLLGPIRQYALERLEAAGEAADYAARHANVVLSLPRSGEVDDYGPDEVSSLDRFELDHANLRAALRWALDHGHPDEALRAASALFRFWERRGHFQEGCAWLEEALASTGEARTRSRASALNALAFLYWRVGDVERAQPVAEQALTVNREIGSTLAVAWALGNLGAIAYFRDELEAGVVWLEESVALGRQAGYGPFLSLALTFLGRSLLRLNGPSDPRVAEVLHESLALAERPQTRYAMGHALMTLGDLHWRHGQVERAVPLWHRALLVRSEIADRRGMAGALERLAWGLVARNKFESAAWLFGATHAQHALLGIGLRNDEQVDNAELIAVAREHLGDAFASAWSAGQSSTVDEAVFLALELTG